MPGNSRNSHVVADMQRIFAPLADRPATSAADRAPMPAVESESPRRRDRKFLFAAPVFVALAGVALASAYIGADIVPVRPPAQPIAAAKSTGQDEGTGYTSSAATDPDALLAEDAGREAVQSQDTGDAQSLTGSEGLEPQTRSAGVANRERTGAGRLAPETADASSRNAPPSARSRGECEEGSLDDRCIYQDVLKADNRLRGAFARARRSGVPSDRLTAIQRRWTLAREDAESDPDGTIRRYDRLADLLDQEREEVAE